MLKISEGPTRLRAAVAGVQALPKDMRRELRERTRDVAVPAMRRAAGDYAARMGDPRAVLLAQRATYSPYRDVPGIRFGGAKAVTADGIPGRVLARAIEYGSPGTRRVRLLVHTPDGKPYEVVKRTTVQWRPDRGAVGAFVGPAALETAPDVMEAWLDAVEDLTMRAFGGGNG